MSHTSGNLLLHLIFSTKDRRSLITPEIRNDLFAYLGGIIREMSGTALIINGTADHVHMLIRIRPVQAAAEIARVVKTNSSRWIHEKWSVRFAWQTGYGAFSVSESNVPAVSRYIATQEEHHKKLTFQEEYLTFLKRNKIPYDERYIWSEPLSPLQGCLSIMHFFPRLAPWAAFFRRFAAWGGDSPRAAKYPSPRRDNSSGDSRPFDKLRAGPRLSIERSSTRFGVS